MNAALIELLDLTVGPGDYIVLQAARDLTNEEAAYVRSRIPATMSERVLIVGPMWRVHVLPREPRWLLLGKPCDNDNDVVQICAEALISIGESYASAASFVLQVIGEYVAASA